MPIYAQFEHIIEEMDGKQACTFQKNTTLFFWKSGVPNKHIQNQQAQIHSSFTTSGCTFQQQPVVDDSLDVPVELATYFMPQF